MDLNTRSKLNKLLDIQPQVIIAKEDCEIILNPDDYSFNEQIEDNYEVLNIPGTFEINFPKLNDSITIYLPYNINLIKPSDNIMTTTVIKFEYKKGDEILFGKIKRIETDIMILDKLFENRVKYLNNNITKQLESVWNQILPTNTMRLVHLELILSQTYLTQKDGKYIPVRLENNSSKLYTTDYANDTKNSTHKLFKTQGFSYGYSNDAIVENISKKDKSTPLTDMEKIIGGRYEELKN